MRGGIARGWQRGNGILTQGIFCYRDMIYSSCRGPTLERRGGGGGGGREE